MEKITAASAESKSLDITAQNIEQLKSLFPDVFSEGKIDFDALKAVLGEAINDSAERYNFTWHGKTKARQIAQTPSTGTLRPCSSKEESVNWDTTENLFIEGDNLEVLKLLQKSYHRKVKMIYIDPPYNTGKDFVYKDDFKDNIKNYLQVTGQVDDQGNKIKTNSETSGRYHSDWLNMMYPRLKLARNLLKNDGVVAISIDENEIFNLKLICNEVFGEENFAGEVIWKNSSKNDQKYISMQHEYIVFYVRDKGFNLGEWLEKKEGLDLIYAEFERLKKKYPDNPKLIHKEILTWYNSLPKDNSALNNKHYSWMDETGVYFPDNISGPNDGQYVYDVYHPVTGGKVKAPSRGWFCPEAKMLERIAANGIHFGDDHTTVPCLKTYLKNTEYQSLTSLKVVDGRAASKRLQALFGEKVFSNPKDEILLKDIMKAIGVSNDDIVVDIFAGSATTAHAVFELNAEQKSKCKSILIQYPESLLDMEKTAVGASKKITRNAITYLHEKGKSLNICEIGKERLKIAGRKYDENIDIGFKNFKLSDTNIRPWDVSVDNLEQSLLTHVDSIEIDRGAEDVLYEILLKYGIELTVPVEQATVNGKQVYVVGAGALIVCLDDNITAEVVDGIAKLKQELDPETTQVVFKDAGFADSVVKTNAIQILKQAGIDDVKSI